MRLIHSDDETVTIELEADRQAVALMLKEGLRTDPVARNVSEMDTQALLQKFQSLANSSGSNIKLTRAELAQLHSIICCVVALTPDDFSVAEEQVDRIGEDVSYIFAKVFDIVRH